MLMLSLGMQATVSIGRTPLARKRRTHLAYTTCWETFGSGCRTITGNIREGA